MAEINTRIVLRSKALLAYEPDFQYDEGMLTGSGLPRWMVTSDSDPGYSSTAKILEQAGL